MGPGRMGTGNLSTLSAPSLVCDPPPSRAATKGSGCSRCHHNRFLWSARKTLVGIVRVDESHEARKIFLRHVAGGDGGQMRFSWKHHDLHLVGFASRSHALGARAIEFAVDDDDRNVQL